MKKLFASVCVAALLFTDVASAQVARPYQTVTAQPSNPTGNATTSFTAMGLGVTGAGGGWLITPTTTGKIRWTITGGIANGTASDGAAIAIMSGATSVAAAPANAAAVPASAVVCTNPAFGVTNNASTAAVIFPFFMTCVQNLTVGLGYWADVELKSVTGGTSTITGLTVTATEEQ